MNIADYLTSKGIDFVTSGDNYQFNCPFCPDSKQRCGIHKSRGSWHCFNCERRGKRVITFQKEFDGKPAQELHLDSELPERKKIKIVQTLGRNLHRNLVKPKGKSALRYLRQVRGINSDTIKHFQLGYKSISGFDYISIPFWKNGKLVNIKFRGIDYTEKRYKWRRITGGESSLFHDEILDNQEYNHVYLCEAELDACSLYNAGIKNVVSVTTGAKKIHQEWYERLERFKKIYLVFDTDVDGQAGAKRAAERFGLDRCFNIKLPKTYKDLNDYFYDQKQKKILHNKKDFLKLSNDSRKFEVRNIQSVRDAFKDLKNDLFVADEDEIYGHETPWSRVNRIMGGAKPGYLVVISSPPKIGKTTFAINWLMHLSEMDTPTLLYECEMRPKRLAEKIVAMKNPDFYKAETITSRQLAIANHETKNNIYFGYPTEDVLDLDNVCDDVKNAVRRYGIKVVVFDNLHFLVRNKDVTSEVGNVTRRFKLLAETLNIAFILIVHPRKIGYRAMGTDDFKDSSSIWQDCDIAIMLHRELDKSDEEGSGGDEGEGHYSPATKVMIAGRWFEGGKTMLAYEGRRGLFHEDGTLYNEALRSIKKQNKRKKKK